LEKIDIFLSQWLKMHLKCPPWLEKILLFFGLKLAKNALKLSPMVGENVDIFLSQMAKNALNKSFLEKKF